MEDDAGEFRGGAVDAASERGGTAQSEISNKEDDDDSEAGLEATDEDPAGSRDELTELEGVESRGPEERLPSGASEGNCLREHGGPNGRISYDSERVTRTDAAAVFGLRVWFEFEPSAS